jgi:hypothetical protein
MSVDTRELRQVADEMCDEMCPNPTEAVIVRAAADELDTLRARCAELEARVESLTIELATLRPLAHQSLATACQSVAKETSPNAE